MSHHLPAPFYSDECVTLYCGAMEKLLPLLPKVDALLTDPPYGIGTCKNGRMAQSGGNTGFIGGGDRARILGKYKPVTWDQPVTDLARMLLLGAGRNAVIWGGGHVGHMPRCERWLVWDKLIPETLDFSPMEMAWTTFKGSVRKFTYRWSGMLRGRKGEPKEKRVHPNQKPVALMEWSLGFFPKGISTVIDPYAGSGSVLLASRKAGLSVIGIEKDPQYCREIVKRLQAGK